MHTTHRYPLTLLITVFLIHGLNAGIIDSLKTKLRNAPNDSVRVEMLNYLSYNYRKNYTDSIELSIDYAEKAYELAKKIDLAKGQYDALNYLGVIWMTKGDKDKSIAFFNKGISIAESLGKTRKAEQIRGNLANTYAFFGDLEEAINIKYKNIEEFEKINDTVSLMVAWYGIAYIHMENQNHEKAIPFIQKALSFDTLHPLILANLGNSYSVVNEYDSAFYYLKKGLSLVEEGSYDQTDFLEKIGTCYIETEDYDQGIPYLKKALKNYGNTSDQPEAVMTKLSLVNAYIQTQQISKGKRLFNSINRSEADSLRLILRARYYEYDFKLAQKEGRFKDAYYAHVKFQKLDDSLSRNELTSQLEDIQTKYETEKKDKAISLLSADQQLKDVRIENQKRLLYSIVAFLLLSLLLSYFIYRLYKTGQEKNKVITKALSEKELLLKEIHHRVKNNLQVVSSLLSLQSEYIKDETALSAISEGRNRVKSMALIHQNLYQEENITGIRVQEYFNKLVKGLFETYKITEDKINLNLNIEDLVIDVDTIVPLGLISNELLSNALKYAFDDQESGILQIDLFKNQREDLVLSVKDNGKGFDEKIIDGDLESFGYQMILAFIDKLEAELNIETLNGSHITVTIPKESLNE